MSRLQISMPSDVDRFITEIAKARGIPRARVVRELLSFLGPSLRRYTSKVTDLSPSTDPELLRRFDYSAFLALSLDGDSYDWLSS